MIECDRMENGKICVVGWHVKCGWGVRVWVGVWKVGGSVKGG